MSSNLLNNYEIKEQLGKKLFSIVYKVIEKQTGKEFTLKKIDLRNVSDNTKNNCYNKIKIFSNIKSQYLIEVKEIFFDDEKNYLYITTEYAKYLDFKNLIQFHKINKMHFSEKTLISIFKQITLGLKTLLDKQIIYNNLDLSNILITEKYDQNKMLIKLDNYNIIKNISNINETDMIKSLGIIFYEITTNNFIINENDYKILLKHLKQLMPVYYSNQIFSLIEKCLKSLLDINQIINYLNNYVKVEISKSNSCLSFDYVLLRKLNNVRTHNNNLENKLKQINKKQKIVIVYDDKRSITPLAKFFKKKNEGKKIYFKINKNKTPIKIFNREKINMPEIRSGTNLNYKSIILDKPVKKNNNNKKNNNRKFHINLNNIKNCVKKKENVNLKKQKNTVKGIKIFDSLNNNSDNIAKILGVMTNDEKLMNKNLPKIRSNTTFKKITVENCKNKSFVINKNKIMKI